jgi:hypothetical protein
MSHVSWRGRIAGVFAIWLVIAVITWLTGNHPALGLLALVLTVAAAILWLLLDVSADAEPTVWPSPVDLPVRPPGEDVRLSRLQHLVEQHQSAHEVSDGLHRELARLADQRLVGKYGVSLRADPERARRHLDPELAAVVAQRAPYPRLSNQEVNTLLDRIEAL